MPSKGLSRAFPCVSVCFSFLLVLAAGFLPSCDRRIPEKPAYGGELRIGIFLKPTALNPITTESGISANIMDLLFNSLVKVPEDGNAVPELASDWRMSEDGLTWTFRLLKNARFHDGKMVTAHDVVFTFHSILSSRGTASGSSLGLIREVTAPDDFTVQFRLANPDNFFLMSLGEIGIAPRHLLEGASNSPPNSKDFEKHPIGSGPYRFVRQNEDEVVLDANPDYFGGRPFLEKIVFRYHPTQQASLNNFIAEKIDFLFLVHAEDFGALAQIPSVRVYQNWYPFLYIVTLNMKKGVFQDRRVRQALNLAVNRPELVERALKGKGTPAGGTEPSVEGHPYKPDEALRLLYEAGWRDTNGDFILDRNGEKFEFTVLDWLNDDLSVKTLRLVQSYLLSLGIRMNVKSVSLAEYIDLVWNKGEFDASFMNFTYRFHYSNDFITWHSHQDYNFTGYANPRVDQLLDTGRSSLDPAASRQALIDLQRALHDDPPGIFLFWREMPIAVHERFRGIPEKRMESFRDLVRVWVPKDLQ